MASACSVYEDAVSAAAVILTLSVVAVATVPSLTLRVNVSVALAFSAVMADALGTKVYAPVALVILNVPYVPT